jgi:predicted PurR-regulated permease PerM
MSREKAAIRTFFLLTGLFVGLILAGHFLRHTLSALLTSLVLAYLCNPFVKYLEKRGVVRIKAIALMYVIASCIGLLASFLFIPYLLHQTEALVRALPRYIQNLTAALEDWKRQFDSSYAGEEGVWLVNQIEQALALLTQNISGSGYQKLRGLLFGLFDLILAPILVFLLLYYKEFFKDNLKRMLPLAERRRLIEIGEKINLSLERFILGMLLDCLLVGILTAAALYFLDIEFPILNGLFAGFASIVPFIGVMVAIIPAALLGYANSGDPAIIPKVCTAYFIIHVIIEGNLIKPLVMKRALKLNPLAVIFAVMAMGELLGFWGIVLAIPMAAVVRICAGELHELIDAFGHHHD